MWSVYALLGVPLCCVKRTIPHLKASFQVVTDSPIKICHSSHPPPACLPSYISKIEMPVEMKPKLALGLVSVFVPR